MTNHQPLQVIAHLAAGVAHTSPWGIALDGLLAAETWARHKDTCRTQGTEWTRGRDNPTPPDLDLPLARCHRDPDLWHWMATTAWPDTTATSEVHTWTARVDHRDLEHVATTLPKVISTRQGRYRSKHMPLLVTCTPRLVWRCVGDPDQIADLLTDITTIGKHRTTGEGHILQWQIQPLPTTTPDDAGHLHPDHTLGRTCPPTCHQHLLDTGHLHHPADTLGLAGLRPPYMHPARQHRLWLPTP